MRVLAKQAQLTGSVIAWAIDDAGLSPEDLADKLAVDADEVRSWVSETSHPSLGQAKKLAQALRRPLAFFLRPAPPSRRSVPPSLRRASGRVSRELSPGELRLARRARRIQALSSWILETQGDSPTEVPRVDLRVPPADAGAALRSWSGVSIDDQVSWDTPKNAFDNWREAFELRGVLVLQLQLGKQGLRGFSLSDARAPLIAVNTAENYQARSFTLFHELAHLASATESVCLDDSGEDARSTERWCEEVASAAVLPSRALSGSFGRFAPEAEDEFSLVSNLAQHFKTSLRATAIALIRDGLVSREVYDEIEELAPVLDKEKGFARGRAGGRKAPEQRLGEMGKKTAGLVLTALSSELLTERDARDYLRLDGPEIDDLTAAVEAPM